MLYGIIAAVVNDSKTGPDLSEGATVGPYRVVRRIGSGGMGAVYEAEHSALGVRRALKVFDVAGGRGADFRKRFLSEGRLLARLSHPGLVRVYDLGWDESGGTPWYAMDLVMGDCGEPRTLADVAPGEADEDQVAEWFSSLLNTVRYIHSQGVIHRDIKPDNILVAPGGRLVLSDFGISRIVREELRVDVGAAVTRINLSSAENPGPVMGTKGFVAPEVLRGEAATAAADVYSLGVVFFRLLTGVWYDQSLAPGSAATDATGVDSARLLDNLDYNWSEILPTMLSADPAARPTDLAALAAALRRTGDCPRKPTRRRALAWASAIAACVAVAATVFACLKPGSRKQPVPSFDEVYAVPDSIR